MAWDGDAEHLTQLDRIAFRFFRSKEHIYYCMASLLFWLSSMSATSLKIMMIRDAAMLSPALMLFVSQLISDLEKYDDDESEIPLAERLPVLDYPDLMKLPAGGAQ
jgi:hypothetical protein